MNARVCPACGQPIEAHRAPIEALAAIPLGYTGRAILNRLVRAYPAAVTRTDMVDAVYGATDGGSPNAITTAIASLRPTIERYGWTIPRARPGIASDGYRLVPLKGQG